MTPAQCPSCRGAWSSAGFARDEGSYRRRLACRRCGRTVDDGPRLRVIDGDAEVLAPWLDDDGDAVEVIAHLMGSGGLSLREMEVSDVTIDEIVERHGPPPASLRGFAFPAYCWSLEREGEHTVWLVVIDQGRRRISFHTRRRGSASPC